MMRILDTDPYLLALALSDVPDANADEILSNLKEAARRGDKRAQYAIATWYLYGKENVVSKDIAAAFEMIKPLEKSFIAEALFDLAIFYDYGRVVDRDEEKAFSFYMQSALLGKREACKQVSEYFREGKIVKYDRSLASAWLKRAKQDELEISPPYRMWLRPHQ